MRHDYDLPAEWASMTDAEKSDWLTRERCRRQSRRQHTATEEKRRHAETRLHRRQEAAGYVSLRRNR